MRNITRKEVRRWMELGARPGVVGEVWGHYRGNRSTELTWCYNRNTFVTIVTPSQLWTSGLNSGPLVSTLDLPTSTLSHH